MKLIRDVEKRRLVLVDDNTELFSMGFFFDEFVWDFNTKSPITITRDVDENFYDNLNSIMSGNYFFSNNGLSSLNSNKLVWFSDQYCDFEDAISIERVSRLVIEKEDDCFKISTYNPFYTRFGFNRKISIVFSPMGNGYCTRNLVTGSTFQDDVVINLFWKSFDTNDCKKYIKSDK